jgi:hypothetical protein
MASSFLRRKPDCGMLEMVPRLGHVTGPRALEPRALEH